MHIFEDRFEVRFSNSSVELKESQRLRYRVFIEEMGGRVKEKVYEQPIERDEFDVQCQHLLLIDHRKKSGSKIVGVMRLMVRSEAERGLGFSSAKEYNLGPLMKSHEKCLELGRTCIDSSYRNSLALHYLWKGIGSFAKENDIDLLFGVASFPGNDVKRISMALSLIHNNYLAPIKIRPKALKSGFVDMNLVPKNDIDDKKALSQMPSLLKACLRLGATVGEGAFMDQILNTIDVCIIIDLNHMTEKYRDYYGKSR